MKRKIILIGMCFVIWPPRAAHASCGSASCPIDTHSQERSEKGFIRLDYSMEYIDQNQPRIGRRKASVGEVRGHHDEVFTLNEVRRLSLEAGVTGRLSLQLIVPFVHREHQHIHHHQGEELLNSWNFNGMGDMTVLSRYAFLKTRTGSVISLISGGVLPTGRDEAVNADGDHAEAGIVPGQDTYSLILGVSWALDRTAGTLNGLTARMPLFLSSTYQWNGKGIDDYRVGNVWQANAGITYPLLSKVGLMAQINARVNRRDDRGQTREEVEKTGGTFIYASPGIQLTLANNLWSYVIVQLPVYQRVNVIQLTSDYNLIGGISYRFSAL